MFKKLVKDSSVYGLSNIALKGVAFFSMPILLRLLSPAEYGVISLVGTLTSLVAMFINVGISNAVQRYYYDTQEEPDKQLLVSSSLWFIVAWAIILVILSSIVCYLFQAQLAEHGIGVLVCILALAALIPNMFINFLLDYARLLFLPRSHLLINLVSSLAGTLFSIGLMLIYRPSLMAYFSGLLLGAVLAGVLSCKLFARHLIWRFSWPSVKKVFSYGLPFIVVNLSLYLTSSIDRWMLTSQGAAVVGLYSVAFKLASISMLVYTAFSQAWSPLIYRLFGSDPEYRSKIAQSSLWFYLAMLALVGSCCLFSREILFLLTPRQYWQLGIPLVLLQAAVLFSSMQQFCALGISLEKQTRFISYGCGFGTLINVVVNLILIPRFGINGAAIALISSSLATSYFYYIFSQKLHYLPFNIRLMTMFNLCFIVLLVPLSYLASLPFSFTIMLVKLVIILSLGGGLAVFLKRKYAHVMVKT